MDPVRLLPLLRLLLTPSVTPPAAARLLKACGNDPERVLAAPRDALASVPGVGPVVAAAVAAAPASADAAARERSRVRDLGLALVGPGEEGWPRPLVDLHDPPPLLYAEGGWVRRDTVAVAIVGSRKADDYGRSHGGRLARDLAARGVTIVSGLAVGIDAAAHRGALEAVGGRTVAVLGCGHAHDYPRTHRGLRRAIAARGAVLSELPLDTPPSPWNFPARNRLIAALGRGTLVVQAAARSGSLGTAYLALEVGRQVMGLPGPARTPLTGGVHHLLRLGAAPVEEPEQILELLGLEALLALPVAERAAPPPGPGRAVWEALGGGVFLDADSLTEATGLPAGAVRGALVDLEIEGLVRAGEGGRFGRA